jgi:hypothetical protein
MQYKKLILSYKTHKSDVPANVVVITSLCYHDEVFLVFLFPNVVQCKQTELIL